MKVGVKALVVFDKKILLILRDNKPSIPSPNTWMLPGGGIEEGETGDAALERELSEELNVVPVDYVCLGQENFEGHAPVLRYLVRIQKDDVKKLKLGEGQEMRFFSIDEATNLPFSPWLGNFIKRNKEHLKEIVENDKSVPPDKLGLVPSP